MEYCAICEEDIALQLDEKFVTNPDGTKSHLDCYLRAKNVPKELIDQAMFPDEHGGKVAIRQTEPGGPVVVTHDLLPDEDR